MNGIDKFVVVFATLCAMVVLSGCTTTETHSVSRASSAAVASTESVAVSVSTETTTTVQTTTPPPNPAPVVDVLSDAKKPCGTVAADAPKFIVPEAK